MWGITLEGGHQWSGGVCGVGQINGLLFGRDRTNGPRIFLSFFLFWEAKTEPNHWAKRVQFSSVQSHWVFLLTLFIFKSPIYVGCRFMLARTLTKRVV